MVAALAAASALAVSERGPYGTAVSSDNSSDTTQAQRAADLHREIFVMDAHTHMINRQLFRGGNIGERYEDGQVDLPRIRAGGVKAIFFSLYSLEPYYAHRYELKHTLQLMELA